MNKTANVVARPAVIISIVTMLLTTIAGLVSGHTLFAGITALTGIAMTLIAFTRRGFFFTALLVIVGLAPLFLAHGHPWLAGIAAYVGLTMLFLAWNHAVHTLNRASDESQARWTPATEQR